MSGDVPGLTFPLDHVGLIRLRRPERANRIEPRDLDALQGHLDAVEARGDVRVLLLAAEGKTFCAGFDLGALTAPSNGNDTRREHGFEAFANRLATARPITIAVLEGPVVGGATDLTLACDLRIGTERVTFTMPAGRIGVPLYAGALHRYVARLGLDQAKRLVLLGETVPAATLGGYLTETVAPGQAEARALVRAGELAALPAAPLAAMKQVMNAAAGIGPRPDQRALLDAAYDPVVIAERVAAMKASRR